MKKIYFSHSMKVYNTEDERKQLKYIQHAFGYNTTIINPNTDIKSQNNMSPYLKAVRNSDALIASEFKNSIGKGVYCEIKEAMRNNIPIFVIRKTWCKWFQIFPITKVPLNNINDWKVHYAKIRIDE